MLGLDPATLIARIVVLIVAFSIHEFAHAFTANYFGDDTPRMNGRLTLNPLAHLDPLGSLLLIVAGFGWAKPVPINPYALLRRSSAGVMWVSLAGPFSNLLMAIVAAIPLRMGIVDPYITTVGKFLPAPGFLLEQFVFINIALMLFNLIPISPLDGDKIADYFFPPSWSRVLDTIRPYGPIILLMVAVVGPYIGINLLYYILWLPTQSIYFALVG